MERPTPSGTMPRKDNERDMELDKRIEALRRKNEALMKRYQEVEEDRKRAEEEGMALQNRKGKADDLTITITKSTSDTRVVVAKPSAGGSPPAKGQQEIGSDKMGEDQQTSLARGRRKQLMVTMAGKKGKRVVCERAEKKPGPSEEGEGTRTEPAERVKQPSHHTKRDAPQDEVRQSQRHTEKRQKIPDHCQKPEGQQASTDLTIPTSKEEQEEYLRWKREREQIDRERVARHKNAKGQWRREWDVDKTDNMFAYKSPLDKDRAPSSKAARNTGTRRGHTRPNASSRGKDILGKEKEAQTVPVVSSKAKGKDRLTGRARRWDSNEEREHLQSSETALEEFLEELDAFTDPETETERNGESKSSPSLNVPDTEEGFSASGSAGAEESAVQPGSPDPAAAQSLDSLAQEKAEASPPRGVEKKVRFSSEPVKGTHTSLSAGSDSTGPKSAKASSPSKIKRAEQAAGQPLQSAQEDAGCPLMQGELSTPAARRRSAENPLAAEIERDEKDSVALAPGAHPAEKACASPQESSEPPTQNAKCNTSSRTTEELIDSSLCVQGSGATAHTTSTDKTRQNGKIV